MFTLFYLLPRLTILILLVILIGGVGALLSLGRQEDPTLIERFGNIIVVMPGADAERMEALVSQPLEAALMELPEIDEVMSTVRSGTAHTTVMLRPDLTEAEVDDAWTLIRAKADQARAGFPPGASAPVVTRQYIGASTMTVALIWDGPGEPPRTLMRRLALDLQDKFQRHPGTELTDTFGLPVEEVRVIADTEALAAAGLSLAQAASLLATGDSKTPAGTLRAPDSLMGVEVAGEFTSISRIAEVPIIQRPDGSALRIGDVAEITKAYEDPPRRIALYNNRPAVFVAAYISPNQRVERWAEGANAIVAGMAAESPPGLRVETVFDQSRYTAERLNGLATALLMSAMIVFAVLFLTMGWRSAISVGMAIPLTIGLVMILFNVFGHPLHQMSVTGLVISLGLLIDNAIVVVDEFDQWRAKGCTRAEAIQRSLGHLVAPLGASTLTTALAFAPIALLPGSAGEFVGMIGLSVIYAILASFVLSLTVVPAMAGWFDRKRNWERGEAARPRRWWRDGIAINVITDGYRAFIGAILRFPPLGIAIAVVPALAGLMMVGQLPSQFFPATERDQFQVSFTLSPKANLAEAQRVASRATELILAEPGVSQVAWTLGEPSPRVYYNAISNTRGFEGYGSGWVQLDSNRRTRQIVDDVQRILRQEFPEARFLALPFEQGPPAEAPIELFLRGNDLEILNRLGEEVRTVLGQTPGITYTTASLDLGAPILRLQADESAAAMAGARLSEIAASLSAELEGIEAGSVLEGAEELPVRMLARDSRRSEIADLQSKTIGARPGMAGTPLSALGDFELYPKTAVITRRDGVRVNQILAYLDPYTLPAPSLAEFQTRLAASDFRLPQGYDLLIGGEAENSGDAIGNLAAVGIPLMLVMAGAITLVFNSFRMMLLIFSTGIFAVFYAFGGVWLFNLAFGFNAIIGSLGLFGIAINGSIVVLSLLRASPEAMAGDRVAQREVVVDASRHIVATTLTTMGGFVPILLSGDVFWLPLAAGIAGGVLGSAFLALFYTPAVFRIMTSDLFRRGRRGRVLQPQPAE